MPIVETISIEANAGFDIEGARVRDNKVSFRNGRVDDFCVNLRLRFMLN